MENPKITEALTRLGGVAERLTQARLTANLSGRDLAARTGFAPSKVSKIELGRQMPTADDVHTLLRACGSGSDAIRATQEDLEQLRLQYPAMQRGWDSATETPLGDEGAPSDLRRAYELGYADAVREVTGLLERLSPVPERAGP